MILCDFSEMIGKTIKSVKVRELENVDDRPYLDIEFIDGDTLTIVAEYDSYTGNSINEYPVFIRTKKESDDILNQQIIPLNKKDKRND